MEKLYQTPLDYLLTLPAVPEWDELRALLERASKAKTRHWQLPEVTCQAMGGLPTQALPASAALFALYLAIVLVDDMIDADAKGYHIQHGYATTAHLAGALQALGLEAMARAEAPTAVKTAVSNKFNQMLLSVALGQYWDTHTPQDEESYWRIVGTKSSPFFGAALYAGAMMGGATEEQASKVEQIGGIYGELIQLHDDLRDVMQRPANSDWIQGRAPLPILFATLVSHPQQARFKELQQTIRCHPNDLEPLTEAQSILIHCGAVSYVIDQLLRRHQKAESILEGVALANRAAIGDLLNDIVQPAYHLLQEASGGVPHPISNGTRQ